MKSVLYTLGHSNHEIATFIAIAFLRRRSVTAICDVRSHPYSRHVPQYSRKPLKAALASAGIAYIFLGKELGARSKNPEGDLFNSREDFLADAYSMQGERIAYRDDAMTAAESRPFKQRG